MSIRRTISIGIILLTVSFQVFGQKNTKPNVLLIYTDDHRYTGVHALGGMQVKTPNLDELASEGIAFTNAYMMGSFLGATCIPSRAMLHTGRNLFQLEGAGYTMPEKHTTIGEALMNAGYYAHHVGKWHQDFKSLTRGFHGGGKVCGKPRYLVDQFRMPFTEWQEDGSYEMDEGFLLEYNAEGEVISRPLTDDDKRGPTGTEKNGPHVSEVLADDAIDFIDSYKKKKPFYMYLAFPTPHDPRQAPQEYYDMYPLDELELTPSYMSQHPFDNGHIVLRDEELAEWPRTVDIAKKHLSEYYAIISHLDAQIGRVIEALKKSGNYENTIIIMAGDSGLGVGNHGLLGKQNIYNEDGVHIPLILSGGLINESDKGRREDALCYNHDIMPTILDLAGVPQPESVTGLSLVPVIEGESDNIRDCTYHAYRQFQRAFRKGDYKLIEYVRARGDKKFGEQISGSRVTQLFDLSKDPWETFDLAAFPEYIEIIAELRSEMKEKAKELGDVADGKRTSVDFWEYY